MSSVAKSCISLLRYSRRSTDTMPSSIYFAVTAAAIAGFSRLAQAQTNITANACADGAVYSSCNRNVADKWGSCVNDCNGNGNCIVDCGCTAHQEYINCMAQACWNQVCHLNWVQLL